jgi:hypothetical protein
MHPMQQSDLVELVEESRHKLNWKKDALLTTHQQVLHLEVFPC